MRIYLYWKSQTSDSQASCHSRAGTLPPWPNYPCQLHGKCVVHEVKVICEVTSQAYRTRSVWVLLLLNYVMCPVVPSKLHVLNPQCPTMQMHLDYVLKKVVEVKGSHESES